MKTLLILMLALPAYALTDAQLLTLGCEDSYFYVVQKMGKATYQIRGSYPDQTVGALVIRNGKEISGTGGISMDIRFVKTQKMRLENGFDTSVRIYESCEKKKWRFE